MHGPNVTPTDPNRDRGAAPKWLVRGVVVAVAAVALFFGAILLYAKVINDSPDKLDQDDLTAALSVDTTTPESAADSVADTTAVAPVDTTADSATVPASDPAREAVGAGTGTWVATADSTVGYRVKEILFGVDTEGAGRTNAVEGSLTIEGTSVSTVAFDVDVASITSDDSRRDGQFRGRIMSTDEFPTATFTLTAPIELGTEPVEGANVTATATGDLTLRGVTKPVTFEVTAQLQNGKIGVLGGIDVVFADYSIANPSTGGITTEDHGILEFVLVFEPA